MRQLFMVAFVVQTVTSFYIAPLPSSNQDLGQVVPFQQQQPQNEIRFLDYAIKDRLAVLQKFQNIFNKLLNDIKYIGYSFMSQGGIWGGSRRRSLFDFGNYEMMKVVAMDFQVLRGITQLLLHKFVTDAEGVVTYVWKQPQFGMGELFKNFLIGMLQVLYF